jgi:hypothetical protein
MQRDKILAYAEILAECISERVSRDAGKTVPELKQMLTKRLLKTTGNKGALIERLLNEVVSKEAIVKEYFRRAHLKVLRCIHRYGETGFGDKPPDMCPVEYWLAHLDPEEVQTCK